MRYPFLIPQLPQPDEWIQFLETSYEARHFANNGPLSQILSRNLEGAYLSRGYKGVLVSSNTLGLQATFHALKLEGKRIAVPDFTFAATLQAILGARAVPVVFDVDRETGELCADSVSAYLNGGGKLDAIVHVRCFGCIRDIEKIKRVARAHELPLIVDAAAALAQPNDYRFGSNHGEIEVFSLHATKVFAIGEGGLIAAPEAIRGKLLAATNFGFLPDKTYEGGTNAKLDEFRCAVGLAMLEKMEGVVALRQQHAAKYIKFFAEADGVRPLCRDINNSWSMFPVLLDKPVSEAVIQNFYDQSIEVKRYYYPGIMAGYVRSSELECVSIENSTYIQNHIVCLPIYSKDTREFWDDLSMRLGAALDVCAN